MHHLPRARRPRRSLPSLALAAIALLVVAAPARAQDWMRDVRVHRLANGLTVLLAPDDRVPHVSVELWLPTGQREDPPDRPGLSHLFEHVYAGAPLDIDTAGMRMARPRIADSNAQVRKDYARYFLLVDPAVLDAALATHAARLRVDPAVITDSVVAMHRQVVRNEQRNAAANGTAATAALDRVFGAGHPYAAVAEHEGALAAIDAAQLRAILSSRTAPSAAVLVVVGRFDPARARRRIAAHFEGVPAGTAPPLVRARTAPHAARWERHELAPASGAPRLFRRFLLPALGDSTLEVAELALRWAARTARRALHHPVDWHIQRTPGALGSTLTISTSLPPRTDLRALADALESALRQVARGAGGASDLAGARQDARVALLEGTDRIGFFDSRAEQLAEGLVLAGDARWLATRAVLLQSAHPARVAAVARDWLAGRGVELLIPDAEPARATPMEARATPVAIEGDATTPFTVASVIDTTLGGLRVVLAPVRHVPLVRATVAHGTQVETVTLPRETLAGWIAALAMRPRPRSASVVYLVGDVPPLVLAAVARATARWPAGVAQGVGAPPPRLTPGDSLVSAPGRAQLRIVAEWQLAVTGAASLVEAQLVARRLSQLLTLELRTRRGWSYGVGDAVEVHVGTAIVRITTDVQPDRAVEALALVREEIARLADGRSPMPALATARETLLQAALLEGATLPGRERQLMADVAAGRRGTFREEYVTAIRALDAAALDRAARLLSPASMRTTLTGDPAILARLG